MSSSGAEGSAGSGAGSDKEKLDALYEGREPKKIIRIITVTAYMVSVSFVGVALSAYYIFLWHPPNPRLMHSHALNDARVEARLQLPAAAADAGAPEGPAPRRLGIPWPREDAADGRASPAKTRRQVMSSVNAILAASYERSRWTSAAPRWTTAARQEFVTGDNTADGPPRLVSVTDAPSIVVERSPNSLVPPTESGSSSEGKTTPASDATELTSATSDTSRSFEQPMKKQHQTPFSLKHLQVPRKQAVSRRRWAKTSARTATSALAPISYAIRGNFLDKSSLQPATTDFSLEVSARPELQDAVKNLFRTLTTPSSDREADYTSSAGLPDMPLISSDQFQAIPRANNDYQDSTVDSGDELLDD